jgi:ATP-dependent RNA helicase DDX54/DBP10
VEANLDLRSVQYVVFDEADRLFEMGFEIAMNEILHKLPSTRQTLLFSATLPKTLVEFAKAGLQDPKLVRLDADSKISSDLRMAFFSVKQVEKDACLLSLLRDVIKVPLGGPGDQKENDGDGKDQPVHLPHQTLIFAATKHHVEYLHNLLTTAGYAVSHIYGSLDQHARSSQMERFRKGLTSLLVVTDVAARGIDIPVLENVINYDFPRGARIFIHRVGRTARAGRQGWAWSLVTTVELPFLVDLQLFLGRPLAHSVSSKGDRPYVESLVLAPYSRELIDEDMEYIRVLDEKESNLPTLRAVMVRGHGLYERSQGKASPASYTRAKSIAQDDIWGFSSNLGNHYHPVLAKLSQRKEEANSEAKNSLLKAITDFKPPETVLEVGKRGKGGSAVIMDERRKALNKAKVRIGPSRSSVAVAGSEQRDLEDVLDADEDTEVLGLGDINDPMLEDEEQGANALPKSFRDPEFYLSHYQKDAMTDKG